MRNKYAIAVLFILWASISFAQQEKTIALNFLSSFENELLVLNDSTSFVSKEDSIEISSLKFYCSAISFLKNGKVCWAEKSSYHLVDVSNKQSYSINLVVPQNLIFDEIKFNLGIDSATNEIGAMGGDLDPTKGMYWAWNSGYINFKLEGKSSKCKTRNNEFQFHLGGYLHPYNALQTVSLVVPESKKIAINLDIKQFLATLNLREENHIMSPSAKAVVMASTMAKCFSIK